MVDEPWFLEVAGTLVLMVAVAVVGVIVVSLGGGGRNAAAGGGWWVVGVGSSAVSVGTGGVRRVVLVAVVGVLYLRRSR